MPCILGYYLRWNLTSLSCDLDQGAIGSIGQAVGGPLDKEGMIGKHFNADGAIGGTAQSMMGGKKST